MIISISWKPENSNTISILLKEECNKLKDTIEKLTGSDTEFYTLRSKVSNPVQKKIIEARRFIEEEDFSIEVILITTFKMNKHTKKSMEKQLETIRNVKSIIRSREDIPEMLNDWEAGDAPPIQEIELSIENKLYNKKSKENEFPVIIFSTKGNNLSRIFDKYKNRIFNRNIRLDLGRSSINKEIENTIQTDPENFFYLNNGISIICTGYKFHKDCLIIYHPQIINGQQTIRSLHKQPINSQKVNVLTRVIKVDKNIGKYEDLISKIVCGTNRQNPINVSDLMSNHPKQVELWREFKRKGYLYIRKKQTKQSAKNNWKGVKPFGIIKKEDLAQYLGATQLNNPSRVRTIGKTSLFKKEYYEKIFNHDDIEHYVLHMYLGQFIEQVARNTVDGIARNPRKKSQWWDARWVVMSIFWDRNYELLSNKRSREKIIKAFKEDDFQFKKSLGRILKKLFDYSNKTYIKKKKDITGNRKSRNDFFGLKNCKKWTEQMMNKNELSILENKLPNELDNFWEYRAKAA